MREIYYDRHSDNETTLIDLQENHYIKTCTFVSGVFGDHIPSRKLESIILFNGCLPCEIRLYHGYLPKKAPLWRFEF